jgi:hypothetical protein
MDNNHMYLQDDELQFHFDISGDELPKKVYFYFYEIALTPSISQKQFPFLKIHLEKPAPPAGDDKYTFPSVDISPAPALTLAPADTDDEPFHNECIEKLAGIISSHEYIENYKDYYKGFVYDSSTKNYIMVFDVTNQAAIFSNENIHCCYIDEIINKKKIIETPVDEMVRQMFIQHPRLLYLTNDDFENLEIPQVVYTDDTTAAKRTEGKYGYFFYLTTTPTTPTDKKYVCFVDDAFYDTATSYTSTQINKLFETNAIIFNENMGKICIKNNYFTL